MQLETILTYYKSRIKNPNNTSGIENSRMILVNF